MKLDLLSSVENDESVSNRIVQFLSDKPYFFIIFLVYLSKLQWSLQNNYDKLTRLISLIHHKPGESEINTLILILAQALRSYYYYFYYCYYLVY